MKCYKCQRSGKNKTDNKMFCDKCFLEVIEKRVRKEIRVNDLIQKNDKLLLLDDNSKAAILNKYFLKNIIRDPTIKIKMKKIGSYDPNFNYDKTDGYQKIIVPYLLDDEISVYLGSFFNNKNEEFLHSKKKIKPVIGVTSDEAKTFLRIKKIVAKKEKTSNIDKMLSRLEKKYPGTRFSILKTIRNMEGK